MGTLEEVWDAVKSLPEGGVGGEPHGDEFERRLDRLLETEDAETADGVRQTGDGLTDRVREGVRREIERARE